MELQITVNSDRFKRCLETVEKALPSRSTMPGISNILFEIKNDSLTFSATNLEMFIKAELTYEGDDQGKILLPPKIIDIMRYFPSPEVNLNINWENYRIDITGGSANFHIYGSNPEDYPASFDIPTDEQAIKLEQPKLKKIIKSVSFATSNEETRPAFNGILFKCTGNTLSLTASDTYRLAIKEESDSNWDFNDVNSLVPARSMRELLRILDDSSINVSFYMGDNMIFFLLNQVVFVSRLLEEKYPDVSGVIPKEYKTRVIVDRSFFEETISRASILTEGKNQAVNIIVKNKEMEIRVAGQEGSMEEIIGVEQTGEDIELFANTRFVLDVLKIIDEDRVVVDFHGDGGPLIFRMPDDQSFLYLVLPIKKVN